MAYTSHPSAPMDHAAAVAYLWDRYQVDAADAESLLARATASPSGMAPHPREGKRTVWANHMTTLGGQFIIETE